jgi:hypothetical protein
MAKQSKTGSRADQLRALREKAHKNDPKVRAPRPQKASAIRRGPRGR